MATFGVAKFGIDPFGTSGTPSNTYDSGTYDNAIYDGVSGGAAATLTLVIGPVGFAGVGGPVAPAGVLTATVGPVNFLAFGGPVVVVVPPPATAAPVPIVEIAFGSNPFITPIWIDVTQFVEDFSFGRGSNRELGVVEAGTLQVTFSNLDRRFDPTYTGGPYYGFIKPGRKIRVRAAVAGTVYPRFVGYIDSWGQQWQGWQDATVTVTASDAMKPLNLAQLNTSYPVQSSNDRIYTVLNTINWTVGGLQFTLDDPTLGLLGSSTVLGPTGDRNIGAGQTIVSAATLANTSALSHMQDVTASEFGLLFASAEGVVTFYGRNRAVTTQTMFATFGESEIPYTDIMLGYDDTDIFNDVRITGASGIVQVASDATSQAQYFLRTLTYTAILNSDSQTLTLANLLLARHKQPALQIRSMTLDGAANPTAQYPQIFGRELGDQVTVLRRPPAGGNTISQLSSIQGISESYSAREGGVWQSTWRLQPVDSTVYWVLGDATRSLLGQTTQLFF